MEYNKKVYSKIYSHQNLALDITSKYDLYIFNYRLSLVKNYINDKDIVLDLCCGTGKYLNIITESHKNIYGLDFSENMLKGCNDINNLICADATNIPFNDNSFDLIFSYSSLYNIQDISSVLKEIHRILKPNGIAIIELTNFYSLGHFISYICYKFSGWVRPYSKTEKEYLKLLGNLQFTIIKVINFQLLPCFGTKLIQFIFPFSSSLFKKIMSIEYAETILDLYLSNSKLFRRFTFKNIYILKK